MGYWTLLYAGTEKALGDWGLCADFAVELVNKGKDTVTFRSTEAFDAGAPQFTWGAAVTIYRDRTLTGSTWSAGSIFFSGSVSDTKRLNQAGLQNLQYTISGPWWLLERLIFQQTRKVFSGWNTPGVPSSGPALATVNTPEVYLGETALEYYQTNGAQITEILNWVNECYNPTKRGATNGRDNSQDILTIGTIDPAVYFPVTRASNIFCSEALTNVLRWSPDCVIWFDYTTRPPTFNCRALANLAVVSQTITAQQEKQVQLAPKYDRQLSGVVITYKQSSDFNGTPWIQYYFDRADAGGSGIYQGWNTYGLGATRISGTGSGTPTVNDYTPFVSRHFVELAGSQLSYTNVAVAVISVAAALTGDLTWWQAADNSLNDPNIVPGTIAISGVTITDASGNPVDTGAYPNILTKGQLSAAMLVNWVDVTITAQVSFDRSADASHLIPSAKLQQRQVTHRVTLTNAVTQTYRTSTNFVSAEQVPVGLAEFLYNSLKTLQYAGRADFVGSQVQTGIGVGNLLSLVGPTNTYANLLIQSVRAVPHLGQLTVTYAPSSTLDAPELVELARACRLRFIYNYPSGRATGTAPGSADVQLGSATAKENTQHAIGAYEYVAATFDQTV